nr:RNA polymerase-associated protein RapA [Tamilnaduibacter salinus]
MEVDLEFVVGQRWVSQSDAALGLGIVTGIDDRRVTLGFPAADEERTYAMENAPLARIRYQPGDAIRTFDDEPLTVRAVEEVDGLLVYHAEDQGGDIREVPEVRLTSHVRFTDPRQRLFAGRFDRNAAFRLRVAARDHEARLQASPARGLIGARTQHLTHQLSIAGDVARRYAPRVLLADEVGLGKTIEAGLILHAQRATGLASRILIVVPEPLVNQWLVEMLRRFQMAFSIVDSAAQAELAEAEEEAPENPFEQSQLVICSLETLTNSARLRDEVGQAEWDLLVVDEAHHLDASDERDDAPYSVVSGLAERIRGVLLLTATPEQAGVAGHFDRLRLLDPDRFSDRARFEREQGQYAEINELIEAVASMGPDHPDLTPRLRHWLGDSFDALVAEDDPVQAVSDALLDRHGTGRVLFRNTRASVSGFPERRLHPLALDCPSLYRDSGSHRGEAGLTPEAGHAETDWLSEDPRVAWLERTLAGLKGEKALVICARAETAEALERYLQLQAGVRSAAFHEGLSLVERDRAAAYFADTEQGARALICSEIGSEGRNFQFARHLILFDLPVTPDRLEQRIGRLDRIGQGDTIDIHIPYLADSAQAIQYGLFNDGLDAFARPCPAGMPVFERVQSDWLSALDDPSRSPDAVVRTVREQCDAMRQALEAGRDALLERNACRPERARSLIEAIETEEQSPELHAFLAEAFDIFGVETDYHGPHSEVVKPGDHSPLGPFPELPDDGLTMTLDRATAVEREDLTFLSWEHPMIQALMEHMTATELGNAAFVTLSVKGLQPGTVLLETLFRLHCPAPADLQLPLSLPVTSRRWLVDVNGRDLSSVLPHDRLNNLSRNLRRKTAQEALPQVRPGVETMIDHAEGFAASELTAIQDEARQRLEQQLGGEVARLKALQGINPAVRQSEIDFFESRLAAGQEAIDRAELVLDGLRVVITA